MTSELLLGCSLVSLISQIDEQNVFNVGISYDVSSQHIASSRKPLFWFDTQLIDEGTSG